MKRRDPALSGVSGITAADVEALDQGRTTLQTIADRVGCSKQAVSRRIKAMRAASPAPTSPAPTGPSAPTAPTGPVIPAGAVLIDVRQAVVSANLGILSYVNATLESGAALGPSAVKALGAAIALARSELSTLGILDTGNDDTALSTLTVRVLSDQEHAEIKRKGELLARDDYED